MWRAAECRRTKGTAPTAQVSLPLRFRHPTPAGWPACQTQPKSPWICCLCPCLWPQEQFQAQAAGLQRSQLFAGVAIHVNGFTSPSHLVRPLAACWPAAAMQPEDNLTATLGGCWLQLAGAKSSASCSGLHWNATVSCRRPFPLPPQELKQLMALHGGEFHNYYHRDRGEIRWYAEYSWYKGALAGTCTRVAPRPPAPPPTAIPPPSPGPQSPTLCAPTCRMQRCASRWFSITMCTQPCRAARATCG